jgi:hypothetical protein
MDERMFDLLLGSRDNRVPESSAQVHGYKRHDLHRFARAGRLFHEHVTGRGEWHPQLWALLFLELWFRRFIDGAGRAEAPGC